MRTRVLNLVCPSCHKSPGFRVWLGDEVVLPAAECEDCGEYWLLSLSEMAQFGLEREAN